MRRRKACAVSGRIALPSNSTTPLSGSSNPAISRNTVDLVRGLYLNGVDPRTPKASPLYADMVGFPPLLIQVGEREILFSDSQRLAQKARDCGVNVTFEEWPALYHVWHLQFPVLSAARTAVARIGEFIKNHTGGLHG